MLYPILNNAHGRVYAFPHEPVSGISPPSQAGKLTETLINRTVTTEDGIYVFTREHTRALCPQCTFCI